MLLAAAETVVPTPSGTEDAPVPMPDLVEVSPQASGAVAVPDGPTKIGFQNGDVIATLPDGSVVTPSRPSFRNRVLKKMDERKELNSAIYSELLSKLTVVPEGGTEADRRKVNWDDPAEVDAFQKQAGIYQMQQAPPVASILDVLAGNEEPRPPRAEETPATEAAEGEGQADAMATEEQEEEEKEKETTVSNPKYRRIEATKETYASIYSSGRPCRELPMLELPFRVAVDAFVVQFMEGAAYGYPFINCPVYTPSFLPAVVRGRFPMVTDAVSLLMGYSVVLKAMLLDGSVPQVARRVMDAKVAHSEAHGCNADSVRAAGPLDRGRIAELGFPEWLETDFATEWGAMPAEKRSFVDPRHSHEALLREHRCYAVRRGSDQLYNLDAKAARAHGEAMERGGTDALHEEANWKVARECILIMEQRLYAIIMPHVAADRRRDVAVSLSSYSFPPVDPEHVSDALRSEIEACNDTLAQLKINGNMVSLKEAPCKIRTVMRAAQPDHEDKGKGKDVAKKATGPARGKAKAAAAEGEEAPQGMEPCPHPMDVLVASLMNATPDAFPEEAFLVPREPIVPSCSVKHPSAGAGHVPVDPRGLVLGGGGSYMHAQAKEYDYKDMANIMEGIDTFLIHKRRGKRAAAAREEEAGASDGNEPASEVAAKRRRFKRYVRARGAKARDDERKESKRPKKKNKNKKDRRRAAKQQQKQQKQQQQGEKMTLE
jgi:hypothetical protein